MRDRLVQLVMLGVAAAGLTGAVLLSRPLEARQKELRLVTAGMKQEAAKNPRIALLQVAPGGLKAVFVTYLWIRSQQLKEDGRFYDARQLRDLICDMMPHFPGVWDYHAWDMAWNISVATHTPEERWTWVHNGITLLRDRGIVHNPDNLVLYRQLSWIFFSKMGDTMDEMHRVYKRRWAAPIQRLLGAPPQTGLSADAVEAFRRVAEAPPTLAGLRAHPDADAALDALAALGVHPDEGFLVLYNRFTLDPAVRLWGLTYDPPADRHAARVAELIRSEPFTPPQPDAHTAFKDLPGGQKVLAFVRRKGLVERYKMDPDWMLRLMEKYGPLDWRHVGSHAIYWATLGLNRSMGLPLEEIHPAVAEARLLAGEQRALLGADINVLNTERNVLNSLKGFANNGMIYYTPNPQSPEDPFLDFSPDYRFIAAADREYAEAGAGLTGDPKDISTQQNTLRDAHINYLAGVVLQLYVSARQEEAQRYYDLVRTRLKPDGPDFKLPLHEFVVDQGRRMGTPPASMAQALWMGGMRGAYRALAGGDQAGCQRYLDFARRAFYRFMTEYGKALRLVPKDYGEIPSPQLAQMFADQEMIFLRALLVQPEAVGMNMPLAVRSRLYAMIGPQKREAIYPVIAPRLHWLCERQEINFERAFPPPPGTRPYSPARQAGE